MSSTTRSVQRRHPWARVAGLACTAVTVVGLVALPGARPAVANPLASAQAQAAAVNAQLKADGVTLDETATQYDAAQQRLQQLRQQQQALQAQIASTRRHIGSDQLALRRQALQAYMSGSGSSAGLSSLFSGTSQSSSAAAEYTSVADGNLGGAIDRLHRAQALLGAQQQALGAAQRQAQTAVSSAQAAQQSAMAAQAAQRALLASLTGRIAVLVAQQQAAQQAAQRAAFVAAQQRAAQQATRQAALQAASQAQGGGYASLPAAGGAGTAVAAAESQVGVPYVWGGETPGVGFDCSGLTQWAWGRAGVSLPRTAAAQYNAIPHVPLSDLQPGDLVFWNDGTSSVQHVAMYVGNNEVVQAPYTGQSVGYSPIWTNGLVGAGRP